MSLFISCSFSVVASNESGVAASCAAVTVNEKRQPRDKRPIFIEYIDSCRAVETFPIKLEAKVAAYPPPEITWFKDSEKIDSNEDHIKIVVKPDGTTSCLIEAVSMDDRGK